MADKKKAVTPEEVQEAMAKAENVSMEDLRKEREKESQNQRMDVFPELLAKAQTAPAQRAVVPTYGQVIPMGTCKQECKLKVASILAMKQAEEELKKRQRERRDEFRKLAETAAILLLSMGITAFCIMGVAFLSEFL